MTTPINSERCLPYIKKENPTSSESSVDTVILDSDESSSQDHAVPVPIRTKGHLKRKFATILDTRSSCSNESNPGSSKKTKLPCPLQLPENISDDVLDILKNKPYHPKFYQARVTMVKKAREFFAGLCPYPSTQEYEAMILCIGSKFPHLSDPCVKECDPPRIKYVSNL